MKANTSEQLSVLTDVYNRLVETETLIDIASKRIDEEFAEPEGRAKFLSNPIHYTVSISEPIEKARRSFTNFVVKQLNEDYKNLTIDAEAMQEYTKEHGFNAADLIEYIDDMYADEDGATLQQIKTAVKELIPYTSGSRIKIPDYLTRIGDTGFELRTYGYEHERRIKAETFLKMVDIVLRGTNPSEVETKEVEIGKVYKDDKVKSLRYFKNNALKVVFYDADDCEKVKVALFAE